MRKNLKSKILLSILAASVFYLPAYANAASLTINGDKITASDSVVDDWNIGTLIYYKNSLQNNTITISNKEYDDSQQIFGAYAAQIGRNDESHTSLAGNIVSIENNSFRNTNSIVGAYALFYNGTNLDPPLKFNSTASLQDNSVTISGSTFNGRSTICGAFGKLYNVYLNGKQTEPTIEFTGNKVTIGSSTSFTTTEIHGAYTSLWQPALYDYVSYYNMSAALKGNSVTINNNAAFQGTTTINGAYANLNNSSLPPEYSSANCMASLTNNSVNINGGTFGDSTDDNNPAINISGAYINLHNVSDNNKAEGNIIASTVKGNSVTISGGTFNDATNVYGAYADLTYPVNDDYKYYFDGTAAITDNTVTLKSTASDSLTNLNLYGYGYNETARDVKPNDQITNHSNNNLIVDGWSGTVGSVNNFENINFENIKVAVNSDTPAASVFYIEATGDNNKGLTDTKVNINSVAVGDYAQKTQLSGTLTLDKDIDYNKIEISDKLANYTNEYFASDNDDNGVVANAFSSLSATKNPYENGKDHVITISATVKDTILAGKFIDADGEEHINSNGNASLTVDESLNDTNASVIAGAYAAGNNAATGGNIIVNGAVTKDLYAGYSENGDVKNNTLTLTGGADVTNVNLFGANTNESGAIEGNKLVVDDWKGTVNSLNNFAAIDFNNIEWKDGDTVLTIADSTAGLSGTAINLNSLKGGSTIKAGDTMTFVASADGHDLKITDVTVDKDKFLAGVALEGEGTATVGADGTVTYTITSVELTPQTDMLAETHAASAAFVNQGTDLISDSLDVLGRDGTYGVKTFAAVQGNRSSYDVADDIKINGWSTIVGVGNADKFDNGSELSWGVFYENGSGNYRTYNSFNNEFFRGDGSMVYNGGGIAARYENKNGVYTEGSLRAGMLKNELDNAMHDVNGSYGYETESAYYGAHIGVGKIISLSDSSDLDIYGKFFHTYTEGDSVTIAGDKFDFDSVTSDRLRVGARVTKQQAKVNTYYGLAYEYEFNGDADMTAQGIRAERQSFGGGSGIAELGFNYQPGTDSPWNFDLNLRGYVGERQGGSFNVQATYTF